MSKKIYGVTVGTPISPQVIREKLKPVTSVNGIQADENGNVEVRGGGSGNGIPAGGKIGQILCKKSDEDYDVEWADLEIPEQYGLITYDQNKTITIT
jgi:hypothetical protein